MELTRPGCGQHPCMKHGCCWGKAGRSILGNGGPWGEPVGNPALPPPRFPAFSFGKGKVLQGSEGLPQAPSGHRCPTQWGRGHLKVAPGGSWVPHAPGASQDAGSGDPRAESQLTHCPGCP